MNHILIATSNPGKLRDFRRPLPCAMGIEIAPLPNFALPPAVLEKTV